MVENAVLLNENMNPSDHSAASINCKSCSNIMNVLISNANEERIRECLSTSSPFQAFSSRISLTRRTANLRVLDSSKDLLLVVVMDAFGA